jgi:type II restriction endonuclease TdeIII
LKDAATDAEVKGLLRRFMDGWIAKQYEELRRIQEEGFSPTGILAPFHDALVPGIRGLGERAFSTSLGNVHEHIAQAIAKAAHADARRAYDLSGALPVLAREFITQRIAQLEAGAASPDHEFEREQLLNAFGAEVAATTRIDLYVTTHSGEHHYFEMKSAKPNKGQCVEMKQRLLTALAIRQQPDAFVAWGVPYDPYGTPQAYAHPYPKRFFDFPREVRMGAVFWNFLGDEDGTYEALLRLYRAVGIEYADRLDELREAVAGREL